MTEPEPLDRDSSRRLSAIVFSDIVGYSKMMGEDEACALRVVQDHNELLVPLIQKARGRILKFMGDGVMSSFDSASDAVLCGVELQRVVGERNKAVPEKSRFKLRIGIHIGDVTERNGEIFGDGVNIAARIQPLADPGGICISQTVYDIVRARREIRMVSLGPRELKNIKEAVHIYKVDVGDGLAASPARKASWAAVGGGAVVLAAFGYLALSRPRASVVAVVGPHVAAVEKPPARMPEPATAAGPPAPPSRAAAPAPRKKAPEAKPFSSPNLELAWKRYTESQPEMAMDAVLKEPKDSPGAARAHELQGLIFDHQRRYLDAASEYLAAAQAYGDTDLAVYCRLLRYIDLRRAGRDADADLKAFVETAPARWPLPLARLYVGKMSEKKVLERAARFKKDSRARPASYYLGMHYLLRLESASGDDKRLREYLKSAQRYFQEATESGAEDTVEHQRAKFELARMRRRGDL